jgi:hypothetical protein
MDVSRVNSLLRNRDGVLDRTDRPILMFFHFPALRLAFDCGSGGAFMVNQTSENTKHVIMVLFDLPKISKILFAL